MNIDMYKAIVPDTSPEILGWRRATGKDTRDEVWEGVYHVIDDESRLQLDLENELETWLITNWACPRNGRVFRDTRLGLHDQRDFDFRVPSLCLYADWQKDSYCDEYLVCPPDVVIEVFDASTSCHQKVDFYRSMGVEEIWILDAQSKVCEMTICQNRRWISTISNQLQPIDSRGTGIQIICPTNSDSNCLFELSPGKLPSEVNTIRKPK